MEATRDTLLSDCNSVEVGREAVRSKDARTVRVCAARFVQGSVAWQTCALMDRCDRCDDGRGMSREKCGAGGDHRQ